MTDEQYVMKSGKVLRKEDLQELANEAEEGYCTEYLGNGKYCLKPAKTIVVGGEELLLCEQHRKGYPPLHPYRGCSR